MQTKIEKLYKSIQEENTRALQERREHAYELDPRLRDLNMELTELVFGFTANRISINEVEQRLMALRKEQEKILSKVLLPPTYLDMRYQCPACKDTGFVGDTIKKPCSCYLKNKQRFMLEGARINDTETFERFSLDIYDDEVQRTRSNSARKLCEAFANKLPNPKPCSMLMIGQCGLGKSYLGNAIAYRAIENGIESMRITAYRFVQNIMSGLSKRENNLDQYVTVPLLVLDDLGIEPLIPNVTRESLMSVISERQGARMATVFISNLNYEETAERYTERFASRLYDTNTTLLMQLTGKDLRGHRR